jgi:RNA polymerase-binding transcription factor DksA
MTEAELKGFGTVLRAKATELKDAIRSREAIAIETNSDLMDQIQHATERELALDRLDRESNLAREVCAALSRIQTKTFRVMS